MFRAMENLDDHLLLYIANCMPLPVCARALRATCRAARRAIPPIPKCMAHKMVVLAARAGVCDVCEEACELGALGLARAMGCEVDDTIRAEWMRDLYSVIVVRAAQNGHDDVVRMLYERFGTRKELKDTVFAWISGALAGGRIEFAEKLREKHGLIIDEYIERCCEYFGRSGNIAFIRKMMQMVDSRFGAVIKTGLLGAIARGAFRGSRAVCDAVFEELARLQYDDIVTLRLESAIARGELGAQFDTNFIDKQMRNCAAFLVGCSGKQELCEHVRGLIGSREDRAMIEGAIHSRHFRLFCWLMDTFLDMSVKLRAKLLNDALSTAITSGNLARCIKLRARGARLDESHMCAISNLSATCYYMAPKIVAWAREDGFVLDMSEKTSHIDRVFAREMQKMR